MLILTTLKGLSAMTPDVETQPSSPQRRPYTRPVLTVFGSVTAITATNSMGGQAKDGGPNNIKT
jgi:hypothetical protein